MANVGTPSIAYAWMNDNFWSITRPLRGGSAAMRLERTTLLPQEKNESGTAYNNRLKRSFLMDGYNQAIRSIVSKPFSVPVTVANLPDDLLPMLENVDRNGTNLTDFARAFADDAINAGVSHILVDYPPVSVDATAADEAALEIRPFWRHIKAEDLISWTTDKDISGRDVLTRIRIREVSLEKAGEWNEIEVERIRVLTIAEDGTLVTQVYRSDSPIKTASGNPVNNNAKTFTIESEDVSKSNKIMLVTAYTNKRGYLVGMPPLWGVAEANIAHWQTSSDQSNILRMSRFGILFAKGFTDEESRGGFNIGPLSAITAKDATADLKIVESSGSAINSGRQDVQDKEQQMVMGGMQPFIARSGNVTATEQAIAQDKSINDVLAWVQTFRIALEQAFTYAAEWAGVEIPDNFAVTVFSDFSIAASTAEDIKNLLAMRQAREISAKTFLDEVKRRDLLGENVNIDAEIQAVEDEGPALSDMGFNQITDPAGIE